MPWPDLADVRIAVGEGHAAWGSDRDFGCNGPAGHEGVDCACVSRFGNLSLREMTKREFFKLVGATIRWHRKAGSQTQSELAVNVEEALSTIHYWEAGTRRPDLEDIGRLAKHFGISPLAFFPVGYYLSATAKRPAKVAGARKGRKG